MMRRIQCLKDLEDNIENQRFPKEFVEYLKEEFNDLYEYLSNGERIEEFELPNNQVMVVLEYDIELEITEKRIWDLEFVDEIKLTNLTVLRIGLRHEHDMQLFYYMKNTKRTLNYPL